MGRYLLYVEDEDSDVCLLSHAFEAIGLQDPFRLVIDGEAAIQYLSGEGEYGDRRRFPIPCMVLLDLHLPRKNGFEVLQWRRENAFARRIPVVVFTSSRDPRDVERAYDLGAAGYLTKDPNHQDWTKRACAIRDFWLELNIPPTASE